MSLWLPSESELWQIDCEQLACKSFHSEGLCSRPAAYTLRLQRLRDAQLSGGTILGRVSADAQQDWCLALCLIAPLASAFFHFPTVLSTKFTAEETQEVITYTTTLEFSTCFYVPTVCRQANIQFQSLLCLCFYHFSPKLRFQKRIPVLEIVLE